MRRWAYILRGITAHAGRSSPAWRVSSGTSDRSTRGLGRIADWGHDVESDLLLRIYRRLENLKLDMVDLLEYSNRLADWTDTRLAGEWRDRPTPPTLRSGHV